MNGKDGERSVFQMRLTEKDERAMKKLKNSLGLVSMSDVVRYAIRAANKQQR